MKLLRLASLCALAYANHISASIENSIPSTVTHESIFVRAGKQSISLQAKLALPLIIAKTEKEILQCLITSNKYLSTGIFILEQSFIINTCNTDQNRNNIQAFYNGIDPTIDKITKNLNLQSKLGKHAENTIYTIIPIAGCVAIIHAGSNLIDTPVTIQQSIATCTGLYGAFLASIYVNENDVLQSIRNYIDKK